MLNFRSIYPNVLRLSYQQILAQEEHHAADQSDWCGVCDCSLLTPLITYITLTCGIPNIPVIIFVCVRDFCGDGVRCERSGSRRATFRDARASYNYVVFPPPQHMSHAGAISLSFSARIRQ